MTTMTDTQMVDHIKSKKGHAITKYKADTDRYDAVIGLYRMLFNVRDEPKGLIIIAGKGGIEFWTQNADNTWDKTF